MNILGLQPEVEPRDQVLHLAVGRSTTSRTCRTVPLRNPVHGWAPGGTVRRGDGES